MTKEEKLARVIALRDAALKVLQRTGEWTVASGMKHLSGRSGSVHIAYRTPFQRLPSRDKHSTYRDALFRQKGPLNLPYGLDLWASKKVLNLEWDLKGNFEIVSFHSGDWEAELTEAK